MRFFQISPRIAAEHQFRRTRASGEALFECCEAHFHVFESERGLVFKPDRDPIDLPEPWEKLLIEFGFEDFIPVKDHPNLMARLIREFDRKLFSQLAELRWS